VSYYRSEYDRIRGELSKRNGNLVGATMQRLENRKTELEHLASKRLKTQKYLAFYIVMLVLQQYYQGTNLRGLQKRDSYDEALIESQATKLFKVPNTEASRVLSSPCAALLRMAPTDPAAFDPEGVRRATTVVAEAQTEDMQDAHVEMAVDLGETAAEVQQTHGARMQQVTEELPRAVGEEVQRAREQFRRSRPGDTLRR